REAGLDLVEVSPTEKPPVCRIMDYGKHKYERKKRMKAGSHGHTITIKEIRIRPKTDVHDLQLKISRARKFLDAGHKVQFTMLFRGRERFNRDFAEGVFDGIIADLEEIIKMERRPTMEGRRMTMLISPAKQQKKGSSKQSAAGAPKKEQPPPKQQQQPMPSPDGPAPQGEQSIDAAPPAQPSADLGGASGDRNHAEGA
ncbi:MAG: translation initiation factor IF-3, partial [Phycisphaerales bacterium]